MRPHRLTYNWKINTNQYLAHGTLGGYNQRCLKIYLLINPWKLLPHLHPLSYSHKQASTKHPPYTHTFWTATMTLIHMGFVLQRRTVHTDANKHAILNLNAVVCFSMRPTFTDLWDNLKFWVFWLEQVMSPSAKLFIGYLACKQTCFYM